VSPVDAESVHATYLPPIPPSPAAEPTRSNYSEAALGSVAEIQRGLEELLINQPRFYSKFDNKFATGSGMASPRPVWSDCSSRARAAASSLSDNQELPSLEPPNVDAEVPVMAASATARDTWYAELASVSQARQMAVSAHHSVFSVYCNHCGDAIPDEHHHCSTCDDGDYDLCQKCVNDGVTCNNGEHWMIKRFVKNGMVINSTTETIAPKLKALFSESKTTLVAEEPKIAATRTCNSCIEGQFPFPALQV
jgi:next-to-BRCA1 protein 1